MDTLQAISTYRLVEKYEDMRSTSASVCADDADPYPIEHSLMLLSTCIVMLESEHEIVSYFGSVFGCSLPVGFL